MIFFAVKRPSRRSARRCLRHHAAISANSPARIRGLREPEFPSGRPDEGCGKTPLSDRVQFHQENRTKKLLRYRNGAERLRLPEWVKDRRLRRLARAFGPRSSRWMSEASVLSQKSVECQSIAASWRVFSRHSSLFGLSDLRSLAASRLV